MTPWNPHAAGLRKSYRLPTTGADILAATVDSAAYSVRLTAETGAVARLLSSFSPGLEEVTLVAAPEGAAQRVTLASFLDPLGGSADKSLYTSVAVDPQDAFLAFTNTAGGWVDGVPRGARREVCVRARREPSRSSPPPPPLPHPQTRRAT